MTSEDKSAHTFPEHTLFEWRHTLLSPATTAEEKTAAKDNVLAKIREHSMAPFYSALCSRLRWDLDNDLLETMKSQNAAELTTLEEALNDARVNFGDVEVKDAILNKAHFYCRIGDFVRAREEYDLADAKTVASGGKVDIALTETRIGIFTNDGSLAMESLQRCKKLLERGGDWERRNRLKIYEALVLILSRKFDDAVELLMDSLATFSATEILDFSTFVSYTAMLAMLCVDRPTLKSKILASPEVLQVVAEDNELKEFLESFYRGEYRTFMKALATMVRRLRKDRYWFSHEAFFVRRMRLRAYAQFLEPFQVVELRSMAEAFGVSPEFLEKELQSFAGTGKLCCAIDAVRGIITAERMDARNRRYREVVQQGDKILNRLQVVARMCEA